VVLSVVGCAPRIDRFVVHSGPPGSAGVNLPGPTMGKNLVVAADVTPFKSTTLPAHVTFQRTAPTPQVFPDLLVPHLSANSPRSRRTAPSQVATFQIGAPASCAAFDRDQGGWTFGGLYKSVASQGTNQQPAESNRTSNVGLTHVTDRNWPQLIPNTGALAVAITLNALCHHSDDHCVGTNDRWYGWFSGPAKPGMAAAPGLEVWLQGNLSLVQMGSVSSAGAIACGPPAAIVTSSGGWTKYRGTFATAPSWGVGVRIEGPGYASGSVVLDYACAAAP
jgi:hypothetical protein